MIPGSVEKRFVTPTLMDTVFCMICHTLQKTALALWATIIDFGGSFSGGSFLVG